MRRRRGRRGFEDEEKRRGKERERKKERMDRKEVRRRFPRGVSRRKRRESEETVVDVGGKGDVRCSNPLQSVHIVPLQCQCLESSVYGFLFSRYIKKRRERLGVREGEAACGVRIGRTFKVLNVSRPFVLFAITCKRRAIPALDPPQAEDSVHFPKW